MAGSLFHGVRVAIARLEWSILGVFNNGRLPPHPDDFILLGVESPKQPQNTNHQPPFSLKDLIGDGFLWAVPKHRRSIEKRLKRKFGHPDYIKKILSPKTNIKTCSACGDDHIAGVLCPSCYKKVINETKAMQDAIQEELKLQPVETEVVVLYKGEKDEKPAEFWEGKRIVELETARPSWFSKNLLQQTTQQPATTGDVKPSDLG